MTLDKSTPVHGGNAPSGSECHFPFTYHGKTYDGCTDAGHHEEWCYVKTKSGGLSSRWGVCPIATAKYFDSTDNQQFIVHHTVKNFDSARDACKKTGGVLAHPTVK